MMATHQTCHLGRLYISSDAVIDQDISEMPLLKLFSLLWRRKKFSVLLLYNYNAEINLLKGTQSEVAKLGFEPRSP